MNIQIDGNSTSRDQQEGDWESCLLNLLSRISRNGPSTKQAAKYIYQHFTLRALDDDTLRFRVAAAPNTVQLPSSDFLTSLF